MGNTFAELAFTPRVNSQQDMHVSVASSIVFTFEVETAELGRNQRLGPPE
jgi:hypothetical protein